jgi:hypothetical protein
MSANMKKIINRGGLVAVIVGIVAVVIGGGDSVSVLEKAGEIAAIAGAVAIFVREMFN